MLSFSYVMKLGFILFITKKHNIFLVDYKKFSLNLSSHILALIK